MRAPEAPMGCPRATAPPFTLVLAGSSPNCSYHGDGLDGEGLVQLEQIHVLGFPVQFLSNIRTASTGAIMTHFG